MTARGHIWRGVSEYRFAIETYILVFLFTAVHGVVGHPSPHKHAARHAAERLVHRPPPTPRGHIDYSGRSQRGQASYTPEALLVIRRLVGSGSIPARMMLRAKRSFLGSTPMATNLKTNKSARVTVEDRGPYAKGRLLDVAPQVADRLDLKKSGVAPVVVAPITVPQPDGTVKLGVGSEEKNAQESKNQMGDAH